MAFTLSPDHEFSFVAYDRQNEPILLAETRAMRGARKLARPWLSEVATLLRSAGVSLPFWLIADLDEIQIFAGDMAASDLPDFTIATAVVVDAYRLGDKTSPVYNDLLRGLIEGWLRDFAFDWKFAAPPGMDRLAELGLVEKLKGGMTLQGVPLAALDSVLGNQLFHEPFFGPRFSNR